MSPYYLVLPLQLFIAFKVLKELCVLLGNTEMSYKVLHGLPLPFRFIMAWTTVFIPYTLLCSSHSDPILVAPPPLFHPFIFNLLFPPPRIFFLHLNSDVFFFREAFSVIDSQSSVNASSCHLPIKVVILYMLNVFLSNLHKYW